MLNKLIQNYQISIRNVLYFIAAIPLATVLKVNIWVLEVADFSIATIILLWLFRSRKPGSEKKLLRYTSSIILPFIGFFAWALVTTFFAYNNVGDDGLAGMLLRVVKLFAYMFVFWIMLSEGIRKKRSHRFIFAGFIFGLVINCVFIANGIEANGNINNFETENDQVQKINKTSRKGGLTFYNATGSVIACYLIALVALFMRKKSSFLGIIIALLFYELIVGQSRGAWATFVFGFLLFWGTGRIKKGGLIALLIIIILVANSSLVRDRVTTAQEGVYDGGRGEIALMYLKKVVDDPIIGKGFYGRFYRTDMNPTGSHNQYIQVLLETGIIGLALYLISFMRLWKFIRKVDNPSSKRLLQMVFATQLFSVLPGEFWYGGSIICAQLILYAFLFIEGNRQNLLESTAGYLSNSIANDRHPFSGRAQII